MQTHDWTIKEKPYDLRERLFDFACVIVRLTKLLHTQGPIAIELAAQREAGILTTAHDPVIAECTEPRKILAALLRKPRSM